MSSLHIHVLQRNNKLMNFMIMSQLHDLTSTLVLFVRKRCANLFTKVTIICSYPNLNHNTTHTHCTPQIDYHQSPSQAPNHSLKNIWKLSLTCASRTTITAIINVLSTTRPQELWSIQTKKHEKPPPTMHRNFCHQHIIWPYFRIWFTMPTATVAPCRRSKKRPSCLNSLYTSKHTGFVQAMSTIALWPEKICRGDFLMTSPVFLSNNEWSFRNVHSRSTLCTCITRDDPFKSGILRSLKAIMRARNRVRIGTGFAGSQRIWPTVTMLMSSRFWRPISRLSPAPAT